MEGLPIQLLGVGKDSHMSDLSNWTNGNNAPVCADSSPFPTWSAWEASQRDLYVLDHEGTVVLNENISGGIPGNLEELVLQLVNDIPSNDCDPDLMCGEAITCCDGMLYPTTCCAENCDEPIGDCYQECEDGEFDNSNPCNPMECWDGQWIEIIIDCEEQMGVPCEGGIYVQPAEGICCSTCVVFGDISTDGVINVLDVVSMVNLILNNEYNEIADMNSDNTVNVLDVVSLVSLILN